MNSENKHRCGHCSHIGRLETNGFSGWCANCKMNNKLTRVKKTDSTPSIGKGTILSTIDGDVRSNGFVVDSDENSITVITDFGNILVYNSKEELRKEYKVSKNYTIMKSVGYEDVTLEERVREQIGNLQNSLLKILKMGSK